MNVQRRRKLNRLHNFDYRNNRCYFFTICTQDRIAYFGGVYQNIMCVNRLGSIIWRQWEWLGQRYPYVRLHAFVVMPNHVHGIIEIDSELVNEGDGGVALVNASAIAVGTGRDLSLQHGDNANIKIKSLSELIGAFKTTSSKLIHQIDFPQFEWQRSFYDHIIRNEIAYRNIYTYIINNPAMWDRDRNNIKNS